MLVIKSDILGSKLNPCLISFFSSPQGFKSASIIMPYKKLNTCITNDLYGLRN